MIRYDLRCSRGHGFDAWFSDSAAFERQQRDGLVACPVCGDTGVRRQLARPRIPAKANRRPRENDAAGDAEAPRPTARPAPATGPADDGPARAMRQFVRELHALVRERAEYVGPRFAEEARRRHAEGTAGDNPIWGEASAEEARALREEGIDVVPLPPSPDDKN